MPNFRLLQVSSCLELTGELLRAEDVAALVECLPSVLKALIQIPSTCINAVKQWVHACCGACLLRCMPAAVHVCCNSSTERNRSQMPPSVTH